MSSTFKPTGFARMAPEKALEAQRKGGKVKNPRKGFGSLGKEAAREAARKSARIRKLKSALINAICKIK